MSAIQDELQEVIAPLFAKIDELQKEVQSLKEGPQSKWVSASEAAEILGCTSKTVHNNSHRWRTKREGNRLMILRADIQETT